MSKTIIPVNFHTDKRYKHGLYKHPLYKTWTGMRERCLNPNSISYSNYGGRGIKVCKRWDDFSLFLEDLGEKPSQYHSLDRIDNNGDYTPENCRWSSRKEQSRNKRNSITVNYKGEILSLQEAAKISGHTYKRLSVRIRQWGWSVEKAIETPTLGKGVSRSKYK